MIIVLDLPKNEEQARAYVIESDQVALVALAEGLRGAGYADRVNLSAALAGFTKRAWGGLVAEQAPAVTS